MQCPKCQSSHVQLCSVAYEQGTVTTTTRTTGTTRSQGHAIGTGAAAGAGAVVSSQHTTNQTHTGVQRSAFAERLASPANPIMAPLALVGVLIVFLVAITLLNRVAPGVFRFLLGTAGWSGPGFAGLQHLTWAVIAAAVIWLGFGVKKLPAHRAEVARWKKTWVCMACGSAFLPAP